MSEQKLRELWVLPTDAEVLLRIDGKTPIYSSEKLRESFLKVLAKHPVLKQQIGLLRSLVERKVLNPGWQSKGIINVLKRSILTPKRDKLVVAFYVPKTKKIFVVIDNNTNWFLHYPNSLLTSTTFHEFCHKFSNEKAASFWAVYKNELTQFYVHFFRSLFSIPPEKDITKIVMKYVKLLLIIFEQRTTKVKTLGQAFARMLKFIKVISKLSPLPDSKERVDRLFKLIFDIFKVTNDTRLINVIYQNLTIIVHLYRAYAKMGIPNVGNLCYQELFYPSEVACVLSQEGLSLDKWVKTLKKF